MDEKTGNLVEGFAGLAGKWSTCAAFGTFLLYLFGYLTLRFQLNTYGVATDLDLFDEKYLFAGCRFLVYLGLTLPNLLLIAAIVALLLGLPLRLVPHTLRLRFWHGVGNWLNSPYRASVLGCLLALLMIQLLLRQCLVLNNLLLAERLPPGWIASIFLAGDTAQQFFFAGLVAGVLLTGVLMTHAIRIDHNSTSVRVFNLLFVVLFAIECLLLPINYGMVIASRWLPRVEQVNVVERLSPGSTAWLIWENKDVLTFFIRESSGARKLVTVPRKDSQISVVGNDAVFEVLYPRSSK